ncbi:MAG TPA: hypothetical protein VGF23_15975 [Gaiellaceae bacterium]|jgi:hypothetical protein
MSRAFLLAVLISVLAPVAALAASSPTDDGTLVVKNATNDDRRVSVVSLSRFDGAIVGQIDQGRLVVTDPDPNDDVVPDVTGAESEHSVNDKVTIYSGTDIRFRAVGGTFTLKIYGRGVDVNAVGTGSVTLAGSLFVARTGQYSIDGAPFARLPIPDLGEENTFTIPDGG